MRRLSPSPGFQEGERGSAHVATALALASSVLTAVFGFTAQVHAASAGSLDRSFADNGRRLTDLNGHSDLGFDVVIDAGRIIVAGTAPTKILIRGKERHVPDAAALVRYLPDGRYDRSFGHDGQKIIKRLYKARAVAVQPNGKIVVVGNGLFVALNGDLAAARLRRDGSLDRSFGHGGVAPVGHGSYAGDVAIQANGKIVLVGYTYNVNTGDEYLIMARFLHNGQLDPSFADDGTLITDFGTGTYVEGHGLAIQPDGKLLVSGTVGNNWILARFLRDGTLDPSFGNGSGVEYAAPLLIGTGYDVALQPDGRIVTAGTWFGPGRSSFAVGRFLADGSPDPSFGNGGAVETRFNDMKRGSNAYSLALQPDGRIVVAGWATEPVAPYRLAINPRFALARYLPDGQLDPSFAHNGRRMASMHPAFDRQRSRPCNQHGLQCHEDTGEAVAIDARGRIVMTGYSNAKSHHRHRPDDAFATARFLGSASR